MDKAQVTALLSGLVCKKDGAALSESEFIKAADAGATFNVYPVKGSAATVLPGTEITKILKANFPKSAFTFFTRAAQKAGEK